MSIKRSSDRDSAFASIKRKLDYAKDTPPTHSRRARLHSDVTTVRDDWQDGGERPDFSTDPLKAPKRRMSFLRTLFYLALIFFIGTGVVTYFRFQGDRNVVSSRNIGIEIIGPAFIDGGELLELDINVTNGNATELELADLIIEYATGSADAFDKERHVEDLGTIRAGETLRTSFETELFGTEGSTRDITVSLQYRVKGSNAIFLADEQYFVTLRSTPIELVLTAPEDIIPNQDVEFTIDVTSQSTEVVENMLLRLEYPPGFAFVSATPAPTLSNNLWRLGDVPAGAEETIQVRGTMRGETGQTKTVKAFIGNQDPRNEKQIATVFNSSLAELSLAEPFLRASLEVDGDGDDIASADAGTIPVRVEWSNTLPTAISDAVFSVRMSGNMFDAGQVNPRAGFYDSNTSTITWSADNLGDLAFIEPGESGQFEFELTTLPISGVGGEPPRDPELRLDLDVRGVDDAGSSMDVERADSALVRINTEANLLTQTLHYSGPISNSGAMPPRVGETTTYSLGWAITNASNTMDEVEVTTKLPSYVTWTGRTAPTSEDISYNPVTREVTWNVGRLDRAIGFGSTPARDVWFQVAITPSSSQVGDRPDLTDDVDLRGKDDYTGSTVRSGRGEQTTRLLNDTNTVGADGVVQ